MKSVAIEKEASQSCRLDVLHAHAHTQNKDIIQKLGLVTFLNTLTKHRNYKTTQIELEFVHL